MFDKGKLQAEIEILKDVIRNFDYTLLLREQKSRRKADSLPTSGAWAVAKNEENVLHDLRTVLKQEVERSGLNIRLY